jgi:hypothetical protein
MFGRNMEEEWRNCMDCYNRWRQPVDHGPVNIDCLSLCRNLRVVVGPDLRPAATRFRHLSAVAVHRTAAGILLAAHCATGHAGKNRRCCSEQEQER